MAKQLYAHHDSLKTQVGKPLIQKILSFVYTHIYTRCRYRYKPIKYPWLVVLGLYLIPILIVGWMILAVYQRWHISAWLQIANSTLWIVYSVVVHLRRKRSRHKRSRYW